MGLSNDERISRINKQFFNFTNTPYSLRGHEKKLVKDKSRLDTRKFFFSQRVVNGWNGLLAEVINSTSVNSFKNAWDCLRPLLLQRYGQQPVHQPTRVQVSKSIWHNTGLWQRDRHHYTIIGLSAVICKVAPLDILYIVKQLTSSVSLVNWAHILKTF